MIRHAPKARLAAVIAVLASGAGCADGPIPELRSVNPWVKQQWAEDEKFGRTYYQKVDELAQLRSQAASLTGPKREETVQQLISQLETERSSALRGELIRTLAVFPLPPAQQAIERAASDEAVTVRRVACRALGERKQTSGVPILATAVREDASLDVRLTAAKALGQIPDPTAAQALRPALDDNDPALQNVAMESLAALTGKPYRQSVTAWREYLDGGSPPPVPAPAIAQQLREWWYWY